MMNYYHGTTSIWGNLTRILPPDSTGIERELRSRKRTDMVYITPSALSAANYAKKAAEKFGGVPVLYQVEPHGLIYGGNNEYLAHYAEVVGVEDVRR